MTEEAEQPGQQPERKSLEERDLGQLFLESLAQVPSLGEINRVSFSVIFPDEEDGWLKEVTSVVFADQKQLLIQTPLDSLKDLIDEKEGSKNPIEYEYEPDIDYFPGQERQVLTSVKKDDALITLSVDSEEKEGVLEQLMAGDHLKVEQIGNLLPDKVKDFPDNVEGYELSFITFARGNQCQLFPKEGIEGLEIAYHSLDENDDVTLAYYQGSPSKEVLAGGESEEVEGKEWIKGQAESDNYYVVFIKDEDAFAAIKRDKDWDMMKEMLSRFLESDLYSG